MCESDTATPVADLYQIATDAQTEGRRDDVLKVLAQIPPVTLGRVSYRVVGVSANGTLTLLGPRGGVSHLVPSFSIPGLWFHGDKQIVYARMPDGTYTLRDPSRG